MKTRHLFPVFAAALLLAACGDREQPGCTDPAALNHDPGATLDDGSCAYVSGLYAGNWIAHDTLTYVDSQTGDTVVEATTTAFSMTAAGNDRVLIAGWLATDCPGMEATVSRTLLVPQADGVNCDFLGFICTHADGRLRYRDTYYDHFRGTAVKQR